MPDDRREEYAEDLDGLDQLPPEVQKYLAESRRFHRQWRGDEGRLTTSTAFLRNHHDRLRPRAGAVVDVA